MGLKVFAVILSIISLILEIGSSDLSIQESSRLKLKLVSVIFRHGDRTPLKSEIYPNDPHKDRRNFPQGYGQLTDVGERRASELGRELRARYHESLNSKFSQSDVDALSTNTNRTKKTLELVLAGLYPDWHEGINKQVLDKGENLLSSSKCPRYRAELQKIMDDPGVVSEIAKFHDFMDYLSDETGEKISDPGDMLQLYLLLDAESSMKLELPVWTENIYPRGRLLDGAVLAYRIYSYSTPRSKLLQKLNGGKVLSDIIRKMKSIEEEETEKHVKLNLYSAHESNIAAVLIALGVHKHHVPQFASAVVVEFYEGRRQYYVKVLEYLGRPNIFETLQIPGCSTFCPFGKFLNLTKPVIPENDSVCNLN